MNNSLNQSMKLPRKLKKQMKSWLIKRYPQPSGNWRSDELRIRSIGWRDNQWKVTAYMMTPRGFHSRYRPNSKRR